MKSVKCFSLKCNFKNQFHNIAEKQKIPTLTFKTMKYIKSSTYKLCETSKSNCWTIIKYFKNQNSILVNKT